MNGEREYYEQFGSLGCTAGDDKPSFSDSEEEKDFTAGDDKPSFTAGDDKPGFSDGDDKSSAATS
jgi:hypothetical protein